MTKKGAVPFVVAIVGQFLKRLRRQKFCIRCDGEFALQSLLRQVERSMKLQGYDVEVQGPAGVASQQSIGGAEKKHDVLTGLVWT